MFLYTLARFAAYLGAFLYCIFRRLLACSLLLWYTEENDVGGHPTMNTDVLFDRAFAIRAAKPWQHLFDTHILQFAFLMVKLRAAPSWGATARIWRWRFIPSRTVCTRLTNS